MNDKLNKRLSNSLAESQDNGAWIATRLNGYETSTEQDVEIGNVQLALCLDIHTAVTELSILDVDQGSHGHLRGPVFVLMRAQLEAFLVGAWLRLVANSSQRADFALGRLTLDNRVKLARDLESKQSRLPFSGGVLTAYTEHGVHRALDSYAHAGAMHLARYFDGSVIAPRYGDVELAEVLEASTRLALYAFAVILLSASKAEGGSGVAMAAASIARANQIGERDTSPGKTS